MAIVLTWQRSTPGQPQFGLATLTEHYKVQNDDGSQITAAAVLTNAGVPQQGDAHPDFAFMFVSDRYCAETGESASALDVTYTGCLFNDGDDPILPPVKNIFGTAVQTATSQCAIVGLSPNQPFTLQYYSKTTTYVFFSYITPGDTGTAPDPTGDPEPITLSFNDCSFITGGTLEEFVANFFVIRTSDVITSEEIVAGKYWVNTELKTKYYAQPIFGV